MTIFEARDKMVALVEIESGGVEPPDYATKYSHQEADALLIEALEDLKGQRPSMEIYDATDELIAAYKKLDKWYA